MVVEGAVLSDVGCERATNEDCARLVNEADHWWLGVLADGMGGHSAGDVASQLTVDTITRIFSWRGNDPGGALVEAVEEANRQVFAAAGVGDGLAGMGTTCTAVVLADWQAWLAHAGDSRLYLLRNGDIYRLTRDDSQVEEMVRQGLLTSVEARNHVDRNIILKALGTHPELEVARWARPLAVHDGDRFILSSDGLHDLVEDEEIRQMVEGAAPTEACRNLVDMARLRGGPDNITVMILNVSSAHGGEAKETRSVKVTSR